MRAEQQCLEKLQEAQARGLVKLFYFDESGFTLPPAVPYAWHPVGQTLSVPSASGQRLNVLGFLNQANEAFCYPVEGRVNSAELIAAFDAFAAQHPDDTLRLVSLENAPIHHSQAFQARTEHWLAQGLIVHYLPPYSPALNLIEMLWRKIKYEWIPFTAYLNFNALKSALLDILNNVGSKYQITFG